MAWRAVIISNPSKLQVENDQLVILQDERYTIPLEDLCAMVLESPAITLSSALLARLAQRDILLLTCDEKHQPCAALLPTAGHSRLPAMQRLQLESTLPFRKRCWQAVARQKVANQAAYLRLRAHAAADALEAMLPEIGSGDPANIESRAARRYFPALFGAGFSRGDEDDPRNAALNYGYAIARGAVARALAAHGFLLAQGIHHHSELNPFNLADDFLEPFRPMVDQFVVALMEDVEEFGKDQRMALASLLGCDVLIDEQRQPVLRAAEVMAASFLTACRRKDAAELRLPALLPIAPHRYE